MLTALRYYRKSGSRTDCNDDLNFFDDLWTTAVIGWSQYNTVQAQQYQYKYILCNAKTMYSIKIHSISDFTT